MTDQPTRSGWEIRPIGSLHSGWGLIFNGEIKASHPSAFVLGAFLDAKLKGASDRDAWNIAEAMAKRGWAVARGAHGGVQGRWRAATIAGAVQGLIGVEAASRPLSVSRTKPSSTR